MEVTQVSLALLRCAAASFRENSVRLHSCYYLDLLPNQNRLAKVALLLPHLIASNRFSEAKKSRLVTHIGSMRF